MDGNNGGNKLPANDRKITVEKGHIEDFANMFADESGWIETPKLVLEGDGFELVVEGSDDSVIIRRKFTNQEQVK